MLATQAAGYCARLIIELLDYFQNSQARLSGYIRAIVHYARNGLVGYTSRSGDILYRHLFIHGRLPAFVGYWNKIFDCERSCYRYRER